MKLINQKSIGAILIMWLSLHITHCTPVRMVEEKVSPKKDNALDKLLPIALLGTNGICCSSLVPDTIYYISYSDNEYVGYLSSTKLETGSTVTKVYDTQIYDFAISADKTKIAFKNYYGSKRKIKKPIYLK